MPRTISLEAESSSSKNAHSDAIFTLLQPLSLFQQQQQQQQKKKEDSKKMTMNRGMGVPRSWFGIVRKKFMIRTKFPHTKNIIIIHNNTSITSNDDDNRTSCVDAAKDHITDDKKPDVHVVHTDQVVAAAPVVEEDVATAAPEVEEEEETEVWPSEEERMAAAIRIQCVFRAHLARRAFRALRSLVKLQAVVRGVCVRRQARIALHCMHALVRLQVRVRARQLLSRSTEDQRISQPFI